MNMDAASLETLLPTFETMIRDYGVEPSVAFYLWRPILAERVKQYDVDLTIQMQKKKLLQGLAGSNSSAGMEDVKPSLPSTVDPEAQNEVSPPKTEPAEVKDDVDGQSDGQPTEEYVPLRNPLELPIDYSPWHPALRGFIEEAGRVLPADVWNFMRYPPG
jgi:hypothetical protein